MDTYIHEILEDVHSGKTNVKKAILELNKYPKEGFRLFKNRRAHWLIVYVRFNWFFIYLPIFLPIGVLIQKQIFKRIDALEDAVDLNEMLSMITKQIPAGEKIEVWVQPSKHSIESNMKIHVRILFA